MFRHTISCGIKITFCILGQLIWTKTYPVCKKIEDLFIVKNDNVCLVLPNFASTQAESTIDIGIFKR